MSLRLPDSIHQAVKRIAEKDQISANQFVAMAVAEKLSALATAEIIAERANRAPSRKRFLKLLAKAGDAEPADSDR